jgi:hypothetical protein
MSVRRPLTFSQAARVPDRAQRRGYVGTPAGQHLNRTPQVNRPKGYRTDRLPSKNTPMAIMMTPGAVDRIDHFPKFSPV